MCVHVCVQTYGKTEGGRVREEKLVCNHVMCGLTILPHVLLPFARKKKWLADTILLPSSLFQNWESDTTLGKINHPRPLLVPAHRPQ